jgi:hypothetical protein
MSYWRYMKEYMERMALKTAQGLALLSLLALLALFGAVVGRNQEGDSPTMVRIEASNGDMHIGSTTSPAQAASVGDVHIGS